MSQTLSPSAQRPYGLARVCRVWELSRSTVSAARGRRAHPAPPCRRRGPKPRWTDPELLAHIRAVLAASPFVGEGHRKVWARLRLAGIRTAKPRVLRLMRATGLLAPSRVGPPRGPATHDGTIVTDRPDEVWGTDATSCVTLREGTATIFVAVDHCTAECVGIHAANPGTRFEALEPLRQGVRAVFGTYAAGCAAGLRLRHDHGSQVPERPLSSRAAVPGHRIESGLRPGSGGQRLRGALHPDAQGTTALGPALRHRRGVAPGAPPLQDPVQPRMAPRTPPPSVARGDPCGPRRGPAGRRVNTVNSVSRKSGAVQGDGA